MDTLRLEGNNQTYLFYKSTYAPIETNMYMIIKDNEALVIDPHENQDLLMLLISNEVSKVTIILTHEHPDHISGIFWGTIK